MKLGLGIGAGAIMVGALLIALPPQAQEADESETPQVTESEIQLYIDVYAAMQTDHDLSIEAVLASRQTSLAQFREIERRLQREQRLVDRVRQALLDQVKNHAVSALDPDKRATPEVTATPPRAPGPPDRQ